MENIVQYLLFKRLIDFSTYYNLALIVVLKLLRKGWSNLKKEILKLHQNSDVILKRILLKSQKIFFFHKGI